MFNLIRRISHGVIPRPDRPWADDPTSNAPAKRKKRRMSSSERGEDADGRVDSLNKKMRGDSVASDATDSVQEATSSSPNESKAVKEVTKGVKEVELGNTGAAAVTDVAPEAVPLPEEKTGELDELASDGAPLAENTADGDISDDNASSVNEVPDTGHPVDGRSTDDSSQALEQAPDVPAVATDDKVDSTVTTEATTEAESNKGSKDPLLQPQVDYHSAE